MEVLTMKELLETGVHFGHRTRKWNPKMARYIFTERKGIHIIDLEQTVEMFRKAYFTIRDCIANGGEILFVGTKKQVQATIADEAQRCGAHYVNRRWLGGTLTNFGTIRQSIERMKKMEAQIEDGTVDAMPNKEASRLRRQLAKLQRNLHGLRNMERKPDLMFIIDPDVEEIAVREANIAEVPIIAIVDTNCDPDPIEYLIPGNDDAIKATKLITARIADAVVEGREGRQGEAEPDEPEAATAEEPTEKSAETEAPVAEEPAAEAAEATEGPEAEDAEKAEAAEESETAEEPTEAEAESSEENAEAETSEDAVEEAESSEENESAEETAEEEGTEKAADEVEASEETPETEDEASDEAAEEAAEEEAKTEDEGEDDDDN